MGYRRTGVESGDLKSPKSGRHGSAGRVRRTRERGVAAALCLLAVGVSAQAQVIRLAPLSREFRSIQVAPRQAVTPKV